MTGEPDDSSPFSLTGSPCAQHAKSQLRSLFPLLRWESGQHRVFESPSIRLTTFPSDDVFGKDSQFAVEEAGKAFENPGQIRGYTGDANAMLLQCEANEELTVIQSRQGLTIRTQHDVNPSSTCQS